MNQIIIKGRLAADPELRYVDAKNGNKALSSFTVAVDRMYGEGADFFRVQVWGKTAEMVEKHFHKGKEILVQGTMENDPYKDKDDESKKRPFWQLKAQRIEFCGSKNDGKGGDADKPKDPNVPEGFIAVEDDDDIPF